MVPLASKTEQHAAGKGIAELLEGLSSLLAVPVDADTFEATRSQLVEHVGALQAHLNFPAQTRTPASRQANLDPGLPGREHARAIMELASQAGEQIYVAAIWVERMQLVLSRYGQNVAEQVMQVCSQQIISRMLRPHDQLFYWGGAGVLAVLRRDENLPATRSELIRVLATPVNQYFETEHRTIYLPIRMSGELYPVSNDIGSVEELVKKHFSERS